MNNSIQTKRDTGQKGGLKILSAKTRERKKQRAVAVTPEDLGADVPNVGVGRALIVILVLHVVAIGAVIMHTSWTEGKQGDQFTSETPAVAPLDDNEKEPDSKVKPDRKVANNSDEKPRSNRPNERAGAGSVVDHQQTTPVVDSPPVVNDDSNHSIIPTIRRNPVGPSIPVSNEDRQPVSIKTGNVITHKVANGDTLWGLSRKYKVSVGSIKELNSLSGNNIKLGQMLKISQ